MGHTRQGCRACPVRMGAVGTWENVLGCPMLSPERVVSGSVLQNRPSHLEQAVAAACRALLDPLRGELGCWQVCPREQGSLVLALHGCLVLGREFGSGFQGQRRQGWVTRGGATTETRHYGLCGPHARKCSVAASPKGPVTRLPENNKSCWACPTLPIRAPCSQTARPAEACQVTSGRKRKSRHRAQPHH